jgi:hypothetical protein
VPANSTATTTQIPFLLLPFLPSLPFPFPESTYLRALAAVEHDALPLAPHVDDRGAAAVDVHRLVLVPHLMKVSWGSRGCGRVLGAWRVGEEVCVVIGVVVVGGCRCGGIVLKDTDRGGRVVVWS